MIFRLAHTHTHTFINLDCLTTFVRMLNPTEHIAIQKNRRNQSHKKATHRSLGWRSSWTFDWHGSQRVCPRCGGTNLSNSEHVAGCRMDGDGYGTWIRVCNGCGLCDAHSYDQSD